jgi:hypothetical protein
MGFISVKRIKKKYRIREQQIYDILAKNDIKLYSKKGKPAGYYIGEIIGSDGNIVMDAQTVTDALESGNLNKYKIDFKFVPYTGESIVTAILKEYNEILEGTSSKSPDKIQEFINNLSSLNFNDCLFDEIEFDEAYKMTYPETKAIDKREIKYSRTKGEDGKYVVSADPDMWEAYQPKDAVSNMRNIPPPVVPDEVIAYILTAKMFSKPNQIVIGELISGVVKSPAAHEKSTNRLLGNFKKYYHKF